MLIDDLSKLPKSFKEGIRGVLLLRRNKDGGTGNADRQAIKRLTNNIEEWTETIHEFNEMRKEERFKDHRIYSSVNARNMQKAIHEFKIRQLQAQYDHGELETEFYCDIKNRFFSCAMNPGSSMTKYFLLDSDTKEQYLNVHSVIVANNLTVLADYPTKNGWHTIIEPCNPACLKWANVDVKKDDLIAIG